LFPDGVGGGRDAGGKRGKDELVMWECIVALFMGFAVPRLLLCRVEVVVQNSVHGSA